VRKSVVYILSFGLILLASGPARAGEQLVYKTPRGVEFRVTADGLASIRHGGRELVSGGWSVFNAEHWFKDCGVRKVMAGKVQDKAIQVLKAGRAKVRHVKDDVVCIAEYTFAGEDVTIDARIENNHPDAAMQAVGFSGLTFTFASPPQGLMYVQHISYFQAHGIGLCHPGHWAKIGGSWAADDSIGVGTTPWRTGLARTLTLWDYASWAPDKREKLPQRKLLYFAIGEVPPRGARTVSLRLRVSPNRDWKHLLAPYREHFRKTFGAVRYKADDRWIATDYLNHSQKAVGPGNPYGFHGGHRRIDTPDGAKKFCETLIPGLKAANGQGVIVWGQGGDDPRRCMYRPDFDVLPPEVVPKRGPQARRHHPAARPVRAEELDAGQDHPHQPRRSRPPGDALGPLPGDDGQGLHAVLSRQLRQFVRGREADALPAGQAGPERADLL
jgi:hypothetical protein